MSLSPQAATTLDHLRRVGSITRLEASSLHRIAHLPTRIFELRGKGFPIKSETRRDVTGRRYTRYSLA